MKKKPTRKTNKAPTSKPRSTAGLSSVQRRGRSIAELRRRVTEAENTLWTAIGRRMAAETEESEAEQILAALHRKYKAARDTATAKVSCRAEGAHGSEEKGTE